MVSISLFMKFTKWMVSLKRNCMITEIMKNKLDFTSSKRVWSSCLYRKNWGSTETSWLNSSTKLHSGPLIYSGLHSTPHLSALIMFLTLIECKSALNLFKKTQKSSMKISDASWYSKIIVSKDARVTKLQLISCVQNAKE
jgi:hypothetical protein